MLPWGTCFCCLFVCLFLLFMLVFVLSFVYVFLPLHYLTLHSAVMPTVHRLSPITFCDVITVIMLLYHRGFNVRPAVDSRELHGSSLVKPADTTTVRLHPSDVSVRGPPQTKRATTATISVNLCFSSVFYFSCLCLIYCRLEGVLSCHSVQYENKGVLST